MRNDLNGYIEKVEYLPDGPIDGNNTVYAVRITSKVIFKNGITEKEYNDLLRATGDDICIRSADELNEFKEALERFKGIL